MVHIGSYVACIAEGAAETAIMLWSGSGCNGCDILLFFIFSPYPMRTRRPGWVKRADQIPDPFLGQAAAHNRPKLFLRI